MCPIKPGEKNNHKSQSGAGLAVNPSCWSDLWQVELGLSELPLSAIPEEGQELTSGGVPGGRHFADIISSHCPSALWVLVASFF